MKMGGDFKVRVLIYWGLLANGYLSSENFYTHNPIYPFTPTRILTAAHFLLLALLDASNTLFHYWDYHVIRIASRSFRK